MQLSLTLPILSTAIILAGAAGYFSGGSDEGFSTGAAPSNRVAKAAPLRDTNPWIFRLRGCTASDLPGVYEEMAFLEPGPGRERALRLLWARWADLDAAGGLAFIQGLGLEVEYRARMLIPLLGFWARTDLEAALAGISGLGSEGAGLLDRVGAEILMADREKFWRWFQQTRRPLPSGVSPAWQDLVRLHARELAEMAADLSAQPEELKPLFQMLGTAMAEKDGAAGLDWVASVPKVHRSMAARGALDALAAVSPHQAMEKYLEIAWRGMAGVSTAEMGCPLVRKGMLRPVVWLSVWGMA